MFLPVYCSVAIFVSHPHGLCCYSKKISFQAHSLFTGLNDVLIRLEKVEQRPSRVVPRLGDPGSTGGKEGHVGEPGGECGLNGLIR